MDQRLVLGNLKVHNFYFFRDVVFIYTFIRNNNYNLTMYVLIYKFFLPYLTIKLFIHKSMCTIKIQDLKIKKLFFNGKKIVTY